LTQATPYTVAQMLVTDGDRVLIIHRSNNVRSAKNIWSLPSGLHDIGERLVECAKRELLEEFNLQPQSTHFVGYYENIVLNEADAFHWVISTFVLHVENFDSIINREPDKHDEFKFVPVSECETLADDYGFHKSFVEFYKTNTSTILDILASCK
jgi:ADP-ribose pyrophosphatase YjhB (NUDIX family)